MGSGGDALPVYSPPPLLPYSPTPLLPFSAMTAGHHQTDLFFADRLRVDFADHAAFVDDDDAVAQASDFFKLGGNQQHRATGVAQLDELAMNELCSPDVNAAGRL